MELSSPKDTIVLEIPRRLVDKRLDVALFDLLQKKLPGGDFSRGSITRLAREGKIYLNDEPTTPSYLVKLHDRVALPTIGLFVPVLQLEPRSDIEIPVLYEDDALLAINKPEGVQMHPAGNVAMKTVAHWVITQYPKLRTVGEDPLRPGIVHRLDRETSGVLVIAKTNAAFQGLKELFQERKIKKTYIALVYGHMPDLEGQINKPLIRHSGELKRFVVETQVVPEGARKAVTLYRVMARYAEYDLLLVEPQTGRTHQIRVHLASLGCPIVGDKLYAFKSMRRGKKLFSERQMLHALRLKFTLFSKKYLFEAPLPEDFRSVLADIDPVTSSGKNSARGQRETKSPNGLNKRLAKNSAKRGDRVDETPKTVYDDEALKSLLGE
jgi:23S rRNA pseudouridine1911/1915/1917 synthase